MSEAAARGADVRTKQLDGLYLHRRNKSARWSASHCQASGRLACRQLHQQINSNYQRSRHWTLSLNSCSSKPAKTPVGGFHFPKEWKDRIIKTLSGSSSVIIQWDKRLTALCQNYISSFIFCTSMLNRTSAHDGGREPPCEWANFVVRYLSQLLWGMCCPCQPH